MSIEQSRNNKIIMSIVMTVLLSASVYFLYVNFNTDSNNKSTNLTPRDKDNIRQEMVKNYIDKFSKRTDLQGVLIYDIEIVEHGDTSNSDHKIKLLNKYKNLFASSTERYASSTTVAQNYQRDMAIYGWIYIYSKSVRAVPNSVTGIKDIRKWHKDDIESALKMAYIPTSPEIANDKVFLATRLKLLSGYLIDFKSMMTREEVEKYQKLIKSGIEAMDRSNTSIFTFSDSKFSMSPVTYKMLALVALNDTYTAGLDTAGLIESQYKVYKDLKTDDLYSYTWTGIYVNTYYLYYLEHPAFEVSSTSPAYLKKISDAKADMSERLKYSESVRMGFKTRVEYLNSEKGKWEIAKMAMTEIY